MSSTKISYYKPILSASPPRILSLNPISLQTTIFSTSTKKRKISGLRITMAEELTRLPVLRCSGDVENFEIMDEEASSSNGSSEFGSHVMTGGLEYTMNKLSKWLVVAVFGGAILWKHDAEALWAAMGCVLNTLLSVVLKQVFNQERPYSTSKSDPGMPSSHAQSIFFAVVYAILSTINFLGLSEVSVTVGVLALTVGSYLSWLRVSQRHHTISQVIVGAVIGTIFSALWFEAWYAFVLEAFVASLWVRIIVIMGSAMFCVGFLIYVLQHWLQEEP